MATGPLTTLSDVELVDGLIRRSAGRAPVHSRLTFRVLPRARQRKLTSVKPIVRSSHVHGYREELLRRLEVRTMHT